jgi:hypothetical protein
MLLPPNSVFAYYYEDWRHYKNKMAENIMSQLVTHKKTAFQLTCRMEKRWQMKQRGSAWKSGASGTICPFSIALILLQTPRHTEYWRPKHLHFTICGLLIDPHSHFAFFGPTLLSIGLKISSVRNSQGKPIIYIHFIKRIHTYQSWQRKK